MSEKFKASLENGMHHFLKSLEGKYQGITKVWFEPGNDPDVSECNGELRSVLEGRFLLHEYRGSLQGKPIEGMAIIGYSIGDGKLQSAWVDSFHNGTAILFSDNQNTAMPWSALGHYGAEPRWGWRTVITQPEADQVIITMYNIPPGGGDEKAVETVYTKIK